MIKIDKDKIDDFDLTSEHEFLEKLITDRPATFDKKGGLQCEENRLRSYGDLKIIFKTYFPRATESTFKYTLKGLIKDSKVNAVYCDDVKAVTFFPLVRPYLNYNSIFISVSGYLYANVRGVLSGYQGYPDKYNDAVENIIKDLSAEIPDSVLEKRKASEKKPIGPVERIYNRPDRNRGTGRNSTEWIDTLARDWQAGIIAQPNPTVTWTSLSNSRMNTEAISEVPIGAGTTTSTVIHEEAGPFPSAETIGLGIMEQMETSIPTISGNTSRAATINAVQEAASRRRESARGTSQFMSLYNRTIGVIDRTRNNR